MARKNRIKIQDLSRFMVYILGHSPYEFGLIPDIHGFIPVKELLRAIHEESGWSYVNQAGINEVLMSDERHLFETTEKMIRSISRHWELNMEISLNHVPPLLYTPVRRKAHYSVIEKGLIKRDNNPYVLSADRLMAERIGRRKDQEPVIIEVMARRAKDEGILFFSFGDLFIVFEVPPECIAGPPIRKDIINRIEVKPEKKKDAVKDFSPGTFKLKIAGDPDLARRKKGQKKKGWKEELRRERRRG